MEMPCRGQLEKGNRLERGNIPSREPDGRFIVGIHHAILVGVFLIAGKRKRLGIIGGWRGFEYMCAGQESRKVSEVKAESVSGFTSIDNAERPVLVIDNPAPLTDGKGGRASHHLLLFLRALAFVEPRFDSPNPDPVLR